MPVFSQECASLVDSPPKGSPPTTAWAQAAYLQQLAAQGIGYGSCRHDAARCLMLFGQRFQTWLQKFGQLDKWRPCLVIRLGFLDHFQR